MHLYEALTEYAKGEDYPYHMPGHKRRAFGAMPPETYRMDVTEIDGFDDLHAPEGLIKDLQSRIARLYGAEESFCLVGGSTCGILAAVSAAVSEGGHLLMARNCHKSAYHAAYLRGLKLTYLIPPVLPEFGICDALSPEQVQAALEADPSIEAVLIVSPTYEGRISPVREIAKIVHFFGKILIVDEAHGAHLGLSGAFHENSCQAGADLVIHSTHKTLPAMTQTALLHVSGKRVDREKLKRFLRIYQSSSPSYVLMASVDNAVTMMERDGEVLGQKLKTEFSELLSDLSACKHFHFLTGINSDVGKLVIHAGDSGFTGQQIYDMLRVKYHLQLEMAAGDFCLAMFTVGDTAEGFRRMRDAVLQMDAQAKPAESAKRALETPKLPEAVMSLGDAWDAPFEEVPLEKSAGRISAEFLSLYPPGTPLVVPGERITQALACDLATWRTQGLRLRGVSDEGKVRCIL
ncbi:MAG: aminotransferase class V-fold PLP-dependent enzyme [Lachnospiraceae bacterium]|nr:aminotransferase class V-fold PLP-dependent enzyme [Lachnospiraceae bacterium]MBQ2100309.1 aminotransferase class V-fold PLP-dependent enzyme [Lachnospiraceae bacterium]